MKYWEVAIAPLHDDYGDINWLLVTSRDATKQKELEKRVKLQDAEIEKLKQELLSFK